MLAEQLHVIPGLTSADHAAGVDSESINMGYLHEVLALLQIGSITVADAVVKVYSGASAGTKTTAEVFRYRKSGAAAKSASADVWAAWTTAVAATGIVLSNANDDNFLYEIEIESDEMTAGQPWLTIEIAAGATVLQGAIVFVGRGRFQANAVPTAI